MEELIVKLDGKEYKVAVEELDNCKIRVHLNGKTFEVETKADIEEELLLINDKKAKAEGKNVVKAPLPGTVVAINVKIGQQVKEGKSLIKLIAMKMENDILSQKDGIVKEIRVKKNESVNKDDVLVVIE
ncbi:MAG: biotin/lipoyl-containing protein [Nanoarchaeota archaeon]